MRPLLRAMPWICGLAFALVVLGCAAPVSLLSGVPSGFGDVGCFTNFAAGPLIVDPDDGTAIVDGAMGGATTPVMWRPGFSGRRVGSEVEVLDPDGEVVATTGRSYRIAGGYVDHALPGGGPPIRVFWACDFVISQP
jgi:hypothetical protein